MKSKIQFFLAGLFLMSLTAIGQNVSISPSRLYYKSGLGEYKTQEVSVTNSSTVKQAFTISFSDFEPSGSEGKSKFMKKGESEHSCSQWLTATPSFFELDPGQTQKIQVLIQVPASPEANKVKWAAMQVKLAKERKGGESGDKNAIGMGITETFQFIVHIFQSPPTVVNKSAELVSFKEITAPGDSIRTLALKVENNGESILDCASYLEYTQTQTGEEQRQKPFAFTLLPGASREVKFQMPTNLKGKYSVLGVVDIGSRENVLAAELEVEMK
jgi:P pilus assembly chaperone PapD